MIDPETYIQEGLKTIDQLISHNNFATALKACEELLRVNPCHRKVQNYLRNIQSMILKENETKIDQDIAATMHLWSEGRFDELQEIYTKLYQYAPTHKHLRSLIEKLNQRMSSEQKKERQEFIHQALDAIEALMQGKNYADAIQAANELLEYDPLQGRAQEYLKKAKNAFIEEKLAAYQHVVEGADFERALALYEPLLKLNPDHPRLRRLVEKTKAHCAEKNTLAAKIHLNESIARMKELFEKHEYEKVLQACEEIDRLDPGNWAARAYKKKAYATIRKEADVIEVQQLKDLWAKTEIEYKKNPAVFVKV